MEVDSKDVPHLPHVICPLCGKLGDNHDHTPAVHVIDRGRCWLCWGTGVLLKNTYDRWVYDGCRKVEDPW